MSTPLNIEMARTAARKLLDKARAYVILDQPFFATIMMKHPLIESLGTPTLAVTPGGTIYYNPLFVAKQTADQVVWALCHEILHYAAGHAIRKQNRDHRKWNIAGDMYINDVLNTSGVGQKIPGCLDAPGSKDRTCEDIYASFPPDDDEGKGPGSNTGQPGDPLDGDPLDSDMDESGDALSESEKSVIDAQRKIEVSEAAQVAKMKGKLPGALAKFAESTVESKINWYDCLERFMTERIKQDTSWARPNRRYAPDFYLPTMDSEGAMGEVVVQVDISGSVSREEIRHYNGHMKRIIEQCKPSKVHVLYTDTQVQKHEEFNRSEDVQINYHSGGGTCMEAGFRYLEEKGIAPEVVVTLTDGYDSYTSPPPFPAVWCVSTDQTPPYGHIVRFDVGA